MEYFNIQPEEIKLDILSRLPTESALECKLVCKNWRNIVSHHPLFSKMHLDHLNHAQNSGKFGFIAYTWSKDAKFQYYEFDENHTLFQKIRFIKFTPPFENSRFLSSCNGLLCFAKRHTIKSVCICNPVTREYVMVPELKTDCCDIHQCMYSTSGFGYVSSTNEYKVVGICMSKKPHFAQVHIYTLGSGNGWRNLGKFSVGPYDLLGRCIFADGAVYWMAFESRIITTFDLAEEKFGEHLSLPPLPLENEWSDNTIGLLDGSLIFAMFSLGVEGNKCYDIWLKRKKNDNRGMTELEEHQSLGWSKKFRVDKSKLLAITMSNGALSCIDNYGNICDTEVNIKEWFRQAVPHMNTLVSLKELGEEDTKIMEAIEIEETENCDYQL